MAVRAVQVVFWARRFRGTNNLLVLFIAIAATSNLLVRWLLLIFLFENRELCRGIRDIYIGHDADGYDDMSCDVAWCCNFHNFADAYCK